MTLRTNTWTPEIQAPDQYYWDSPYFIFDSAYIYWDTATFAWVKSVPAAPNWSAE